MIERRELKRTSYNWKSEENYSITQICFCAGSVGGLEHFFDIPGVRYGKKITACFSDKRPKGGDYYELRKLDDGVMDHWWVADIDEIGPSFYRSTETWLNFNFDSVPVFIWIELDA